MLERDNPVDILDFIKELDLLDANVEKYRAKGIHFCVEEGERVPSADECLHFLNILIPQGADCIGKMKDKPTVEPTL